MEDAWLTRRSEDLQTHVYPFHTLPKITSHIHPKFAVYALGHWLRAVRPDSRAAVLTQWPSTHKVVKIWGRWMQPAPPRASSDPSYIDPDSELLNEGEDEGGVSIDDRESDGDSVATRPRRIAYPPPKRIRRPPPHLSPMLASQAIQGRSLSPDEGTITPIDQDGSC